MLTVKVIQDGVTSIRQVKDVVVLDQTTDQMKQLLEEVRTLGTQTPDYVEIIPELNNADGSILQEGEILISGERKSKQGLQPTHVLVEDAEGFVPPYESRHLCNTAHTFIYTGDELYVTGNSGATILAIRPK